MSLKYKQLTRLKNINRISSRVLNFKRSKWNKIKQAFYSKFSKGISVSIYNSADSFIPTSFWNKVSKNYKENLNIKRKYKYVFGKNLNVISHKVKLDYLSVALAPYYSPACLLFFYGFSCSRNHSKQKSFSKKLYLNDNILKDSNIILKSGDIIKMIDQTNLIKIADRYNVLVNSSISEFDVYSQQFVFIKDLNQLSEEDVNNIMFETIKFF